MTHLPASEPVAAASARQREPVEATHELAIDAHDLVKTYPTGRGKPPVRALAGLSLRVRAGEVFGVLGPNGAGKSTTVKILATLCKPDSGRALVAGHDVTSEAQAVRSRIGLVAQGPGSAPLMTGRESLELAGRVHGLGRTRARRRSSDLLERFGLAAAADRLTRTYSGGMQRRLDVAVGLVGAPDVLFLDEPTTGLDPEARAQMWKEIARLASHERLTVVLTTHYLEEADHLADRVAIIDTGRMIAQGTPDGLKRALHGDTLVLELTDNSAGVRAAGRIGQIDGLRDVSHEGVSVRARTISGATALPTVVADLEQAGIAVRAATVARPSLDDVYFAHTGHTFAHDVASREEPVR